MVRILIVFGTLFTLSACTTVPSALSRAPGETRQANQAEIIKALDGGLFGMIGNIEPSYSEKMLAMEAEYRALEHTPAGQSVSWQSESSGISGVVVAAQPYRVGAQDCRTYSHTVNDAGGVQKARGTACRNGDGSWSPLA